MSILVAIIAALIPTSIGLAIWFNQLAWWMVATIAVCIVDEHCWRREWKS